MYGGEKSLVGRNEYPSPKLNLLYPHGLRYLKGKRKYYIWCVSLIYTRIFDETDTTYSV